MTLLTKFRSWIGGTSPMQDLVDPEIEEYAAAHSVAESDVCRLIREETYRTQDCPQMVVGPLEAAFLKVMALAVRAQRVLEIGTFTGYSALAMAEALPEDGTVLTCEIDPDSAAFAHRYWDKSPHGKKIEARVGPALETLSNLTGPFDVIFIDADKANYVHYYRRADEPLPPPGPIRIGNVLWVGGGPTAKAPDPSTQTPPGMHHSGAAAPARNGDPLPRPPAPSRSR